MNIVKLHVHQIEFKISTPLPAVTNEDPSFLARIAVLAVTRGSGL